MDDLREKAKEILCAYDEITSVKNHKYGIEFDVFDVKYLMCFLDDESFPWILLPNGECPYPHFSLKKVPLDGTNYQSVCLFESGILIEYIHSFEEKIQLCVNRLIKLIQMSEHEKLIEYQKEFLVYWKAACSSKGQYGAYDYSLFLDNDNKHQWLDLKIFDNKKARITKSDRFFNDLSEYKHTLAIPVLYLPIIDARNMLPPLPTASWNAKNIVDIICGQHYQRISDEALEEIERYEFHKKELLLVFKLNAFCFGCIVKFENSNQKVLLDKIKKDIHCIFPLYIHRCDHLHLNMQIGNRTSDKKIAIIGAGSLGSYIANELVHAGYKNLLIIDGDKYEYANIFRHRVDYFANDVRKARMLAYSLNAIHPEVNAVAIDDYLSSSNYKRLLLDNKIELVIFTVGSSDVQLKMNKAFVKDGIDIPILYAWLEHDGETSHVAVINDIKEGCFECLYTDQNGDLGENTVNKADKSTIEYIRNGCGGTRVPYGNKTLLTASAMILRILNDNKNGNLLYSYYDDKIIVEKYPKNGRCKTCGICE